MKDDVRISKLLSYWLRHDPAAGGITLDEHGWADVGVVMLALTRELGRSVSYAELEAVVVNSDKQRFALLHTLRIRANQGHSIDVEMNFPLVIPPETLYHGTVYARYEQMQADGEIKKMDRQFVHLSESKETTRVVATRYGKPIPVILCINTKAMALAGYTFYQSANKVYLTDSVPLRYLRGVIRDFTLYKWKA